MLKSLVKAEQSATWCLFNNLLRCNSLFTVIYLPFIDSTLLLIAVYAAVVIVTTCFFSKNE